MTPGVTQCELNPLKRTGPYESYCSLLRTHIDLLSEDYLCALREQIDKIRDDPEILNTIQCYRVVGDHIKQSVQGRSIHEVGVVFRFDIDDYIDVDWAEEKRLMSNNLVLLTTDSLRTFDVGVIVSSSPKLLLEGRVVVAPATGMSSQGFPRTMDFEPFVGKTFHMVESGPFHCPYYRVTRALRQRVANYEAEEIDQRLNRQPHIPAEYVFLDEIILGILPSRPPKYLEDVSTFNEAFTIVRELCRHVDKSQAKAIQTVLQYRVALIQGPPGTGKTFVGAKIAELFVRLKRACPTVLEGPILVIAMGNHVVREFMVRCSKFSEKVIHCCSGKREGESLNSGPLQKRHDRNNFAGKISVMAEAEIIGMTTTRAATLLTHLNTLGIRIVIVEEAADVLEAHVLASIPIGTVHLIQTGDHRQLRPTCEFMPMARNYNMDLSLFERLVNNGADCPMLSVQRRMRPSIANLIRPIYPNLTDDVSTLNRPAIDGIDLVEPVYFMNHTFPETKVCKAYMNRREAEVAVELASYLLYRGYKNKQITILTTYRRQLCLIKEHIKNHPKEDIKEIEATTVDSFQGDENDIIILSLVRSNVNAEVGFLKMANRACVALSRARNGFFMLGNLVCLTAAKVELWVHVMHVLTAAECVGPELPLVCPTHKTRVYASTKEHFRDAESGCCFCSRLDTICQRLKRANLLDI